MNHLFFQLHFEVLNVVNVINQFFNVWLSSSEELFDLLLIRLHPFYKFSLSFGFLFQSLLFNEFFVSQFGVSEILFVNNLTNLSCGFLGSNRDFPSVNVLDSRQVFCGTKVPVTAKARNLMPLRIIHFGILYSSIVISSELLNSYFPVVQLPQQPVDIIVNAPNLILRSSSILNFLHLLNDLRTHLLPPFLAFI